MHSLAVEMWREPLARARDSGALERTIDDDSAAQRILLNQTLLSRVSVDTGLGEHHAREMARNFILPVFARHAARD